ncbi:MAG: choline kinase family protein [Pseudonocardia sp.]|nr:choline kinase family protein [Pseudonocardia sp.]
MRDRLVGTARTDAERAAEKALGCIDRWAGREIRYAPVAGGLQNSTWRLTVDGERRRYVLKVPGPGSEAFVDRRAANEAAVRAAGLGIGPETVFFDPATGIEVTEFLEGYRACTTGDLAGPGRAEQAVALFRTLHAAGPLGLTRTVLDRTDALREQARELGVRPPPATAAVLAGYADIRRAVLASGLDLVACHNDPTPGNLLIGDGPEPSRDLPMRLIDHEFASNNDRAGDLAELIAEMSCPEPRTLELVEAYYGSTPRPLVARVQVFRALADVRWGLWGLVNHRLGTAWDFDYHKYGVWRLMRVRLLLGDPRWPAWLAAL